MVVHPGDHPGIERIRIPHVEEQGKDRSRRQPTARDVVLMSAEGGCFVTQVVVSVLFYNALGLHWLVILGWASLAVAMVVGWRARVAFQAHGRVEDPRDWLHTRVVVDRGIYGLVRHPMYISFMLIYLGLVLLSGHWLNLALGVVLMGLLYNDMRREERSNLDNFGEAYERYMQRVPRINIVVSVVRCVRSQR
jgi:protein-S-isoprenylcysteine O-methyltransferase Ste14